jgi:soluble lytic murein transglycosylase-like protein
MRRVVSGITALALLGLVVASSAQAQQQHQQQRQQTSRQWGAQQTHAQPALATVNLNDKVELDYLPDFTGKQIFVSGTVHERNDGPTYIQHFKAEATADQVLDWYRQVLGSNKWRIENDNKQAIVAKREGNMVAILVNSIHVPKFNSEYELSYFQKKQKN